MAKDHRSRDQKRKAKLKKRAEKSRKHESLAYHGTRYRSPEYVDVMFKTELGIYESYVMTERQLTDDEVESALEQLIVGLRQRSLPPLEAGETDQTSEQDDESLIVWNIRRNWRDLADQRKLTSRDDLIGILRTTLGSLETWRSQSMNPQGYLKFLEGFMKKAGARAERVGPDFELIGAEEDSLLEVGRDWIEGHDATAAQAFAERVDEMFRSGQAQRAVEVCQQLIGEARDRSVVPRLETLALAGRQLMAEPHD